MWNLKIINTDKSLYFAIADAIERDIQLGILKSGDKMPTHRDLAKTVGVNVTTITRAYKEAEKRGLITATVGSGTFVTADLGYNPSLINTDENEKKLIEMGLVLPLYGIEPDIKTLLEKVVHNKNLNEFMKYTPPQGINCHRQIGADWIRRFGINVAAENIIVTAGAQHAINCILSSVFEQGDRIAVDCLTYPGIKTAAKRCGIRLEAVPMDEEGMMPQGLEAVCSHNDIKGIYTVSGMQNPTNAIMSEQRRNEVSQIIKRNNLILIEDDLYGFLVNGEVSTLSENLLEQSIYISGISKAFYAGLRIGFVAAPKKLCNRISQAVVDTIWMASTLNAEIACECINSGVADEIIDLKRAEIKRRALLMKDKLQCYDYKYAPGSMFAWLKLPDHWSSSEFEKMASDNGVNVISSEKFTVGSVALPNYIRISLSGAESILEFEKGLDILLKVLNRELGTAIGVL
ncbi:MAG: PLP-dependent aminotransferase family protein [Veillonellales bacterium]